METNEKEQLIEELRKVNEKLILSERLKTNFLSNIRNEINNPLTAILGLVNGKLDERLSPEDRKIFYLLFNDVFNLDFQLRNIFLSAEIESGSIILSPSRVDLASLVYEQVNRFSHITGEKKLKIKLNINVEGHFITDPAYLSSILANLISNAVRFCEEEGSIEIEAGRSSDKLWFSISNTGSLISETNQEMIFDRFRQVEEGTTKTHYGHGLGLSITKSLLEYFNGDIALDTKTENRTCFHFNCDEFGQEQLINSESGDGNDFIFIDGKDTVF